MLQAVITTEELEAAARAHADTLMVEGQVQLKEHLVNRIIDNTCGQDVRGSSPEFRISHLTGGSQEKVLQRLLPEGAEVESVRVRAFDMCLIVTFFADKEAQNGQPTSELG